MENSKKCIICEKEYDYDKEPTEIKECGQHICPDCWNNDED